MTIDQRLPALRDMRREVEQELYTTQGLLDYNLRNNIHDNTTAYIDKLNVARKRLEELDSVIDHYERNADTLNLTSKNVTLLLTVLMGGMLIFAVAIYYLAGVFN